MSPRAAAAAGGRSARPPDERLLDAFASRAAHSLGAGVSIAGGYATLLRERFAGPLGDDGLSVVSALEGGLDRLRLFVDDLLELGAIETTPLKREHIGAVRAAQAAAGGLAPVLDGTDVEIEIGAMPEVVADAALLERLFHHLIRTSLSALGAGPGRIAISGVRRAAGVRLEVADDGPPLHPATAGTLFEPFATPRGAGPAAGAGVSMAIARRIAERHGGSAWAHTGRRDGCTVVVLLPEVE
ncbi:MAG: two-component system, chemotaxis family, sensor kinase Cph1 [Solirubrobacteraceae bacterium]|jgi:signal transduction histidine kinase|nr:two-component system, chemotaxis family, sensor kinase Cph1 [Solirubrobacteraceae bacterium]